MVLHQPLEALLLPEELPRPHLRRRRKRVCQFLHSLGVRFLTHTAEKEESDEDMGFGLFD